MFQVDTSISYLHVAEDPATDYWAVREELRMYNPEYCARPHVVALNKMDIPDAADLQEELSAEIGTRAQSIQVQYCTFMLTHPLDAFCMHQLTG